jgi:speckle-type POZ protein
MFFLSAMRNLIWSWCQGVRPPAETSWVTESITATHDFEVRNHQLLHGVGVGKYVSSSTFRAGGYDWNIRFYPDGYDQDCSGNASAYLHRLTDDPAAKDVSTKFTFEIMENQEATRSGEHTFTPASTGMGIAKFIEKSKLKSLSHLTDCFTIRCVLTVVLESRTEHKRDLIVVPPPELSGDLERALNAGKGTDVTFDVRGQVFTAHRSMLAARSTVFDAQIFGTEQDTHSVKVINMEPAIFKMLLHFIYTDSLPPCDGKGNDATAMQHLLAAADLYGLERLKVLCEEKLYKSIDANTVASTLSIADRHDCQRLKDACLEFISLPGVMGAVVASDRFKHIIGCCPRLPLRDMLEEN